MALQGVEAAIEAGNAQYVEASNRGDVATIVALFTDDAVVLPPNSPILRGRQAIQQFYEARQQTSTRRLALETIQVNENGETAWEIGTYTVHLGGAPTTERGAPTTEQGKYVAIWKRQSDGSWKLAVDIWNTDRPLPTS